MDQQHPFHPAMRQPDTDIRRVTRRSGISPSANSSLPQGPAAMSVVQLMVLLPSNQVLITGHHPAPARPISPAIATGPAGAGTQGDEP